MLLATLFLKHQPTAKTFEQAVAMEVEIIEKEDAEVENQLNELAIKERALTMRRRELDAAKADLGINVVREVEPARQALTLFRTDTPPKEEPASNKNKPADQDSAFIQKNFSNTRWRTRAETNKQERRYDSYSYANVAKKLDLGVHEEGGIVWLTHEEWEKVYPIYLNKRKVKSTNEGGVFWRRAKKQIRTRAGTNVQERSYSGATYIEYAKKHGVGSPGIGTVWLTDDEANEANKEYHQARKARKTA